LHFFKEKEFPGRKEFLQEFGKFTRALRRADDETQIAVGHSINMANSMLIKRFGSIDAFCEQPTSERIEFIQSLRAFEEELSQQYPSVALGIGLFKVWVGVLCEQDQELISLFSKEIGYFTRKGDEPVWQAVP